MGQLAERLHLLLAATEESLDRPIDPDLDQTLTQLKAIFGGSGDIVFRTFNIARNQALKAALLNVDGLVNEDLVSEHILEPVIRLASAFPSTILGDPQAVFTAIREEGITMSQVKTIQRLSGLIETLLSGNTALLLNGVGAALVVETKGFEFRPITEPVRETTIRGPQESFTEVLRINTSLIRRKIRTPLLRMDHLEVGRLTRTTVVIAYIRGIASDNLVEEVRNRVQRVDIDGILDSGYLEGFIQDSTWSPFPQVQWTERPDIAAANLLEGRVVLIVDGSPNALIVPATFWRLFQSAEDYYERSIFALVLRLLRHVNLMVALLLPALYVSIVNYHDELIPTTLLLTIAASRAGIPFPTFVETLVLEIVFEALREAGVRLPRPTGQAVSIVGALVIGLAAVQAGVVSAPVVIVVAVTGVASFALPRFSMGLSIRLLRFPLLFLAASFGLFGVMTGLLVILVHVCALRSFGVPYFSPVSPLSLGDLKDVAVRVPWPAMVARPRLVGYEEPQRQEAGQLPRPPVGRGHEQS